jgi:hypothetical protein
MQFKTILLLSALALVVAAPNTYDKPSGGYEKSSGGYEKSSGGYEKPSSSSSSSGYEKSSSSSSGYTAPSDSSSSSSSSSTSSDSGYGHRHHHGGYGYSKPHFAAPSFGARMRSRLHRLGHALHHLFGEFMHFFHTRWVNFKSDMERMHWWMHCRRQHFHVWYKWQCDIRDNKRKLRSKFEHDLYNSLCKMEKEKKSEYDARVHECKTSGEDYTDEQITNYVDAVYEESSKPYEGPSQPTYEEPSQPTYEEPTKPTYDEPSKPTYDEPSKPTYDEPSKPAYKSSKKY